MTNADFELLMQVQAIIARLPREYCATPPAYVLLRAVESDPIEAERLLRAAGLEEMTALLGRAAYTLRSTGFFSKAEDVDAFASRLRTWNRREDESARKRPRNDRA